MYVVVQTIAVVLVFLAVTSFFTQWDGQLAAVRPPAGPEPATYEVLIVEDDGTVLQRTFPAELVLGANLPISTTGLPPEVLPEDGVRTSKSRFTLNYLAQRPAQDASESAAWQSYPTTTPQSLGLAVMLWLLGLGIRNMVYSGTPWTIDRQRAFLPKQQTGSGQVAQSSSVQRGRKGPPPGRARRGPRR